MSTGSGVTGWTHDLVIFAFLRNTFWYTSSDLSSPSCIWTIHLSQIQDWETISLLQEFAKMHFWHPAEFPHMKHFNSMASGSFTQFLPDDPAKPAPTDLFMIGHLLPRTRSFLQVRCLTSLADFDQSARPGIISFSHSEHLVVDVIGISIHSVKLFDSSTNSALIF